jgi:hypothetical protein
MKRKRATDATEAGRPHPSARTRGTSVAAPVRRGAAAGRGRRVAAGRGASAARGELRSGRGRGGRSVARASPQDATGKDSDVTQMMCDDRKIDSERTGRHMLILCSDRATFC